MNHHLNNLNRVRKYRLKRKIINEVNCLVDQVADSASESELSDIESEKNVEEECEMNDSNSLNSTEESDNLSVSSDSSKQSLVNYYSEETISGSSDDETLLDSAPNSEKRDEDPDISELRKWVLTYKVPGTHVDGLLRILKKRVLPKLPLCSKTLMHTLSAQYTIETMYDHDNEPGEFAYLGIEEGLKACVNKNLHPNNVIELDFNIDGAKIKKSSKKSLWPILCRVLYKPLPNIYKPFTVCLFYGIGKPKDVHEYCDKFIDECNDLLQNGFQLDSRKFSITIRSFICDTPARAMIKCTKGHQSFNGCEKCDHVARKCDRTTVYLSTGEARTDTTFRNFTDVDHHNGVSPLISIDPPINLVLQFILDSMHLFFLGVMLALFSYWFGPKMEDDKNPGKNKKPDEKKRKKRLACCLSVDQINELNRRTKMIKKDIPKEFQRQIRPTNWYNDYKAVEHRCFCLYIGPLVLKNVLQDNYYDHFLLFHVAARMLSINSGLNYTRLTKQYLKDFVEQSQMLYDEKFVTLNVHNLEHVSDDAKYLQSNLTDASAFAFENELGKIKRILRSPHRTVAQYCRRVHEERTFLDLKAKLPEEIEILKENLKNNLILSLKYKQQYFSTKHPNNTAILENKSVVMIQQILKKDNIIYLTVFNYRGKRSVYKNPCDSALLDIYEIDNVIIPGSKRTVQLKNIQKKMFKTTFNFSKDGVLRTFVEPMLH